MNSETFSKRIAALRQREWNHYFLSGPGIAEHANSPPDRSREALVTLATGFNDSGSFVRTLFPPSPSPSRSFSFDGWTVSANAGGSFSDKGTLLPDPLPPATRFLDLFGDPVVGCTNSATFYYASLATRTTTGPPFFGFTAISLSKSTDGGASFGGAKIAVQKPIFTFPPFTLHSLDKEWMAVQRVSGADTIHITYTDFFFNSPPCPGSGVSIEYVRSTDGGATFSSPIVIDQVCGFIPALQGSHVAVGNGSDVYVAWEGYPNGLGPGRQIKVRKSTNGGVSFPAPAVVVTNGRGERLLRSGPVPGLLRLPGSGRRYHWRAQARQCLHHLAGWTQSEPD